ncbi:UNVERIFIED_CONTAM: hypothetical protein RKD50_009324 [Streptomyces canus]
MLTDTRQAGQTNGELTVPGIQGIRNHILKPACRDRIL